MYLPEHIGTGDWIDACCQMQENSGYSLNIVFSGRKEGNFGGWGIIFSGEPFDAGRYSSLGFTFQCESGNMFEFKIEDTGGNKLINFISGFDRNICYDVKVDLGVFNDIDLGQTANINFGFNERYDSASLTIDNICFE